MNKNLKKTMLAVLTVLMVMMLFAACDMGLPWDIETWGVWEGDNTAWGSSEKTVITITNKTLTIDNPEAWEYDYSGEIVDFDNDSFNVASENPSSGDYGYLIFKVLKHEGSSDYAQAQIGKYIVIRWKELTDTGVKYCEGGKQFETLEEAQAADAECFYTFSSLTKSEE